jgi:hypothetical protein
VTSCFQPLTKSTRTRILFGGIICFLRRIFSQN